VIRFLLFFGRAIELKPNELWLWQIKETKSKFRMVAIFLIANGFKCTSNHFQKHE